MNIVVVGGKDESLPRRVVLGSRSQVQVITPDPKNPGTEMNINGEPHALVQAAGSSHLVPLRVLEQSGLLEQEKK